MIGDILQPTHLLFILAVALLVLGPKRLPEVGRSLGKGLREFRGAMSGLQEQANLTIPAAHEMPPAAAPAEPRVGTMNDVPMAAEPVASPAPAPFAAASTVAHQPSAVATVSTPSHEPAPSEYAD